MKSELIIVFSENDRIISVLRSLGLTHTVSVIDSDISNTDILEKLQLPNANNYTLNVQIPIGSPKHIFEIRDFYLNRIALKFRIKLIIDSQRASVLIPLYYLLKCIVRETSDMMIADSSAAQQLLSIIENPEFDGLTKHFKKTVFQDISVWHL